MASAKNNSQKNSLNVNKRIFLEKKNWNLQAGQVHVQKKNYMLDMILKFFFDCLWNECGNIGNKNSKICSQFWRKFRKTKKKFK